MKPPAHLPVAQPTPTPATDGGHAVPGDEPGRWPWMREVYDEYRVL